MPTNRSPSKKTPAYGQEARVPAMLRVRGDQIVGIEDHLGNVLGMPLTVKTSGGSAQRVRTDIGGIRTDILTAAEAEASRIVNRMTVLPTQARRGLITAFIGALINADVWDRMDGLYLMAAHDEQAAKLNWRGVGAQDLVNVNGCVFDPNKGLQGDGSTSYLTTGLAGNAADNYKRDSAFAAIWSLSNSGNNAWHDMSGAGGMYINSQAATGSVAVRCNNSSASSVAAPVATSTGLTAINRNSATEFDLWRDDVLLGTPTNASEAVSSAVFWIGRNATNYSGRKFALAAIGGGLTPAQYAAFYAAARAYLVAVGAVS